MGGKRKSAEIVGSSTSEISPNKQTAKNKHGNVDIPIIDLSLVGTKAFPISVYRGTKGETGLWFARIGPLPGYLGQGETEAAAITSLWKNIGAGPLYDVRRTHRLEPTPENIRYRLEHAKKVHAAKQQADKDGATKSEQLAAIARAGQVSRPALMAAIAMDAFWRGIGGVNSYVARQGYGHMKNAIELGKDPQAYFENNPESAAFFLARLNFPSNKQPR